MNFLVQLCSQTEGLGKVVTLLKNVVTLLQWGIPMILILFGMIDLGKAVMAGKEDEMKKAQSSLLKRVIYAIAVYLVVTIVIFITGMVGSPEWNDCWKSAGTTSIEEIAE